MVVLPAPDAANGHTAIGYSTLDDARRAALQQLQTIFHAEHRQMQAAGQLITYVNRAGHC